MIHPFNILSALIFISSASARPTEVTAIQHHASEVTIEADAPIENYTVRWQKGTSKLFAKRTWKTSAQEVWLTGQLLVNDDRMDDVELLIAVENGNCQNARICKNGRFDIVLPAGAKARLTFQKPGHIAKEIMVDASDLNKALIGRGEDRKVNFDVILSKEDAFPGFIHDGPVGSIMFRRGTGAMMVDHHPKLVAAERVCKLNK